MTPTPSAEHLFLAVTCDNALSRQHQRTIEEDVMQSYWLQGPGLGTSTSMRLSEMDRGPTGLTTVLTGEMLISTGAMFRPCMQNHTCAQLLLFHLPCIFMVAIMLVETAMHHPGKTLDGQVKRVWRGDIGPALCHSVQRACKSILKFCGRGSLDKRSNTRSLAALLKKLAGLED